MHFMNSISQFAGVVARVESLRGRMSESTRQVEGLSPEGDCRPQGRRPRFESLLSEIFW